MYSIFNCWGHCNYFVSVNTMSSQCTCWVFVPLPPVSSAMEWRWNQALVIQAKSMMVALNGWTTEMFIFCFALELMNRTFNTSSSELIHLTGGISMVKTSSIVYLGCWEVMLAFAIDGSRLSSSLSGNHGLLDLLRGWHHSTLVVVSIVSR